MRNNNSQKRGWGKTVITKPQMQSCKMYTEHYAPESPTPTTWHQNAHCHIEKSSLLRQQCYMILVIISANCIQMRDQNAHVQHSSELRNTKHRIL